MAELARMAINQATTRPQYTLEQAIAAYARAGVRAIGVWRDKLAECGAARARALLAQHGMTASSLCRAGNFAQTDAARRRRALAENRAAIAEAQAIGAACLVIVAGGLPAGSRDLAGARAMVADGLAELLPEARAAGVTLAVEPLHPMYAADRCCINTLPQAIQLCDALGPGVGIAVDVYHLWWDPDLLTQIGRAGRRVVAFHVCDWLATTKDLLLDRGMMGDGVADIRAIAAAVEAAGYRGPIEVEIFSRDNWWKRPGEEVVQVSVERFRDCV
ncbi:MAG: sugar phosphate isomerase/epimerase [Alphaproteobacteria bacterium]|nr:sugar phosphate isomerase/epimerase [Alphaproteobacteria bacterium]